LFGEGFEDHRLSERDGFKKISPYGLSDSNFQLSVFAPLQEIIRASVLAPQSGKITA